MLNKRTQILFDEKTYKIISTIAQKDKRSIGSVIREAVNKTFVEKSSKSTEILQYIDPQVLQKGEETISRYRKTFEALANQ